MEEEDKQTEETESPVHDIIDKDLYEEFTEEELLELVEDARVKALQKASARQNENEGSTHKPLLPKWFLWLIAFMLFFNLIALLPQTFSIPAVQFLKTSAALSAKDDIKAYKEAVVVIETGESKGTGFSFTASGSILTNYHVIEGNQEVTVIFPNEGMFTAEVKQTFPDIDLAVLDINEDNVPYLDLADHFTLTEDEPIYFIGNPLAFTGIANEGTILDYTHVASKELPVVMMDAPVYRGNSGSPVIDESGAVIGVVFATLDHEEEGRVGLFIPIDYFYDVFVE